MTRASLPRFGSSKGVSTIIGAVFFVLVALLVFNVFLWTMIQNTLYNQAVEESHQLDQDRFSERVVATHAKFTVPQNDTVLVHVTVSNEGPIPAQVISMWVMWKDGGVKKYGFENALDINLNPGDTVSPTIPVTVPGAQFNGTFSGWLVTARGNPVSLEKEKIVVQPQVTEGIGSIMMDFDNFKYYYWNSTTKLLHPEDGIKSTNITLTDEHIVFGVRLTNYDNRTRTITLDSRSLLWMYTPGSRATAVAKIVTVGVDGNATKDYYNQESGRLWYREPKWIYFGPVSEFKSLDVCAVNLVLLGKIDGEEYGQNIPFVSVYITE